MKKNKGTKCICKACNKVWYFGKEEVREKRSNQLHNASKGMMFCSGCFPAVLIRDKEVKNLNKCSNCGSKAIIKEKIIHNV
jgi:DNA-directed RNA polymerase subunit RPC12/RpoP